MSRTTPLRIGTRRSRLALAQTHWVQEKIEALGLPTELVEIVAEGDKKLGQALYAIETPQPGLFTKELEKALLAGSIDVAVHSLKDLPTQLSDGLEVLATPTREAVEDCLLVKGKQASGLVGLRPSALVGTSSLRRESTLLSERSDLIVKPIRGNVLTRIDALKRGDFDAIVLARAGLSRLGISEIEGITITGLDPSRFVPAPGQGALAIEVGPSLDPARRERIRIALEDSATRMCTRIERTILRELEGGCTLPLGVWCRTDADVGWRVSTFLGEDALESSGTRRWKRFRRFDISGRDEQILVAQTVRYFRT